MVFFEKLNKVAKNIESKTGDAIEIAKYTAQIASEENAHKEDLKKIGKYYYDLFVAGNEVGADILPVMESAKAHMDKIEETKALIEKVKNGEEVVEAIEVAKPVEQPTHKYCPSCGATLELMTKFCGQCGHKMEE
ncbi:MAG: zinc-ribbon domain-containing protein [Erysipelotrichaceae bacterium]|nr:zinc-ribbon domain-containing protein [Erysipelotrichaceae bacterium]MBQ9841232.1 zinc-ribbon domain-containing protein [Erysipelotrichaceae bacterium]